MCSLVSAEPSARGCGGLRQPPVGLHPQGLLLHPLAAALQYLGLPAIEQGRHTALEDTINAGSGHYGLSGWAVERGILPRFSANLKPTWHSWVTTEGVCS